jgi:hypothetical protein
MSSPRHDDDSFSVDFSSELISAFDFGGVGRGAPIGTDGIWLDGSTVATEATDIMSSLQFAKRRSLLAKHLLVLRKKGPIDVSI